MAAVQVFGRRDSRDTQKCLRFFKERRIVVSFVDVVVRPPAPGELRRFSQRFGTSALFDREGAAYRAAGLEWLHLEDDQALSRLAADTRLLRSPLARFGDQLSVGLDEATWARWQHEIQAAATRG